MRLRNEVGSAYMTTDSPHTIDRLLRAGWHVVEELPTEEEPAPHVEAPQVRCVHTDPLKYKDRYLSWYVQCGSVAQLRDVLQHLGVVFDRKAVKKDLQALLRRQISEIKAQTKEEAR